MSKKEKVSTCHIVSLLIESQVLQRYHTKIVHVQNFKVSLQIQSRLWLCLDAFNIMFYYIHMNQILGHVAYC